MTRNAMIFLALSWGGVLSLLVWSFARILRSDSNKKR
jgi:hypothetical protein